MKKITFYLLTLSIIFLRREVNAQCPSTTAIFQGNIIPASAWQTLNAEAGQYWTFDGNPCTVYTFSFCQGGGSSTYNTQISITKNDGSMISGAYSDDFCGLQSELTWTPPVPATYRLYFSVFNCVDVGGVGSVIAYKSTPSAVNTINYSMMNNATSPNPFTCVNLTPNASNKVGCAWDVNSRLDFTTNFTYDFQVNLGASDAGADGICFVMQNDPRGICACGSPGGEMGAGGIINSLAIEIDTYLNDEDRDDGMPGVVCTIGGPEPDHLDIWINGIINPAGGPCPGNPGARIIPSAVPLMLGPVRYNIENGLNHTLRISWNAATSIITAKVYNAAASVLYGTVSHSFNPLAVFGTDYPYFGFTGSTGLASNNQSFCNPAVLLPVELVSFYGNTYQEKNILYWATASEINNEYFALQRSRDGETFETIGTVNGAGNSTHAIQYSYIDAKPFEGITYYRLEQKDFDGQESFSDMIALRHTNGHSNQLTLAPNPAGDFIEVFFENDILNESMEMRVMDVMGKTIIREVNANRIDLTGVSKGVYSLTVTTRSGIWTEKFIKR